MINPERLLERFLRYVKIDTTAGQPGPAYPSSPGQLVLGKLLADELQQMGLKGVEFTPQGLVYATVPSTLDAAATKNAPVVAFNAHVDTSPETTGKDVKPQVIRNYAGGDLTLPGDKSRVIKVGQNPELDQLKGKTLVTTDGTTLLGSDDKSGIAVIMELAQHLLEQPELKHGPVRILFTCDEEIGHGVDHVDLAKLGATACYTLDGSGTNDIDVETFSADLATVRVTGINIHPSIAKGRMINALRAMGTFLDRLPRDGYSPETTDGRQGFLHPGELSGGVAEATLKIILRDFDTAGLATKAELLRKLGQEVEQEHAGVKVDVSIIKQYRNLGDGLKQEPRAVAYAVEAHRRLGREANLTIIRGGTDGSQLTERGLPTPNLSTGEHNPHSPLEWTCLEEMVAATEVCTELVRVWGEAK